MPSQFEIELERLVVGTNDQRRRVGQTLFHLYRTFIFWKDKGRSFFDVTRAWSAGGAAIFDAMASTLREVGPPEPDEPLRRFLAGFMERLAGDLERGEHRFVGFLRWLESTFPEITEMMRAESGDSRIYDSELAEQLGALFARAARADREALVGLLRRASRDFGP
jgi:hypothetical protein